MPKIDDTLRTVLVEYDCDPEKDIWNCHGVWVAYHRTLEKIAAKTNITFDPPSIIESDCGNGVVAICVTGRMGDKAEWSFGEAAPKNNKNAYPYAMAEKRAKDRVILKLVGLHGLVYSEEESDDFKRKNGNGNGAPAIESPEPQPRPRHELTIIKGDRQTNYYASKAGLRKVMMEAQRKMRGAKNRNELHATYKHYGVKIAEMPPEWQDEIWYEYDEILEKFEEPNPISAG